MEKIFPYKKINTKYLNTCPSLDRNKSENINFYTKNGSYSRKKLKGRLFKIFNSSLLMTDEKFNEFENKIHYEKYINNNKKKNKNKIKKGLNDNSSTFYYATPNSNLTSPINPTRIEDGHVNPNELFVKSFSKKERDIILTHPQYFCLKKNENLNELWDSTPKNLKQILDTEEQIIRSRCKNKKNNNKNFFINYISNSKKLQNKNLTSNIDKSDFKYSTAKGFSFDEKLSKLNNNNNNLFKIKNEKKNISMYRHKNFLTYEELLKKFKNDEIVKTKKYNEKMEGYYFRRSKIIQKKREKLINNDLIYKNKKLMRQKERERMYNEKIFIDLYVHKLKENYKTNSKSFNNKKNTEKTNKVEENENII